MNRRGLQPLTGRVSRWTRCLCVLLVIGLLAAQHDVYVHVTEHQAGIAAKIVSVSAETSPLDTHTHSGFGCLRCLQLSALSALALSAASSVPPLSESVGFALVFFPTPHQAAVTLPPYGAQAPPRIS